MLHNYVERVLEILLSLLVKEWINLDEIAYNVIPECLSSGIFLYVNIIYRIYYFIDMNDDAADLGDITIVPLKPLHVPESSSMYFKLEIPWF